MPRQTHMAARLLALAVGFVALLHAHYAGAETAITGAPDAVRLEAYSATVDELLAALGASYGLRYRSTAPLNRRVSGTYEGSLQRVVTRLLEGYDFFVKTSAGSIEVVVLGVAKPGEITPAIAPVRGRRVD